MQSLWGRPSPSLIGLPDPALAALPCICPRRRPVEPIPARPWPLLLSPGTRASTRHNPSRPQGTSTERVVDRSARSCFARAKHERDLGSARRLVVVQAGTRSAARLATARGTKAERLGLAFRATQVRVRRHGDAGCGDQSGSHPRRRAPCLCSICDTVPMAKNACLVGEGRRPSRRARHRSAPCTRPRQAGWKSWRDAISTMSSGVSRPTPAAAASSRK